MRLAGVFVIGSINQDYVLRVEHRPAPGETVTDAALSLFPGGKGANQAVAAARLGASVVMFGRVGEDAAGAALIGNLEDNEVAIRHVEAAAGIPTGSAFITVTPDGENAIVVAPGANRSFGPDEVEAASEAIAGAGVLVAQMEVRTEAVEAAARIAARSGGRVLLNLAPPREIPGSLLSLLDPLVVNEHEASFLLGEELPPESAASSLIGLGPTSAVVTLGAAGAAFAAAGAARSVPAPKVKAVDTTGAGDAFMGALATCLAKGTALDQAVAYSVRAGAAAVTREGAQGALPVPDEVEKI